MRDVVGSLSCEVYIKMESSSFRYAVTQVGELCGSEILRVGGEEHIDFALIHRLSGLYV